MGCLAAVVKSFLGSALKTEFQIPVAVTESLLSLSLSRDSTQSHEESLSVLRSSNEFMRHAVSAALQKVQQLKETGHVSGPDGQNPEKVFQNLCDITR